MSDIQKKRGRPATGRTPIAAIRLSGELRSAVDRAIADGGGETTRSEFIRDVLSDRLALDGQIQSGDAERDPDTVRRHLIFLTGEMWALEPEARRDLVQAARMALEQFEELDDAPKRIVPSFSERFPNIAAMRSAGRASRTKPKDEG